MITKPPPVKPPVSHVSLVNISFSSTRKYIQEALSTKRCVHCRWTGLQPCQSCKGQGMVVGEGWFMAEGSDPILEPCRHCIGTGKEACRCCGGADGPPRTEPSARS